MAGAGQVGFEYCNGGGFNGQGARCNVDRATQITVDVIVALAVLYFVVTCILLLSKLRSYRKLPYTFVQVGLVYNTLQASFLAPAKCRVSSLFSLSAVSAAAAPAAVVGNACSLFGQLWPWSAPCSASGACGVIDFESPCMAAQRT